MSIRINEIYKTIQGESTYAGLPCVIVRFSGCNLRCVYCDTRYAYDNGENLSVEKVYQKIAAYNCRLVSITGGEPLIQKEIYPLTRLLAKNNYRILLETNGSLDISELDDTIVRIMDIKCPDSMETHAVCWKNLEYLKASDQVKFVLSSERDYSWALGVVREYAIDTICAVIFSPVIDMVNPGQLAQWLVVQENDNIRMQLQLHKQIPCR